MSSGVVGQSCCWGRRGWKIVGEDCRWEVLDGRGKRTAALARTEGH
jgi:hypothetical protein